MGKTNVKKLNKKKMSGPCLAAMIISILILIGLVLSLLSSSGFFVRVQLGASSPNFTVNGSMMTYFTNAYYQSWYSQYYYYIYLGYLKFDPSVSLKEQYVDDEKKETYFDFFTEAATTQVTQILKYCEAAKADSEVDFAKLESDAKAEAKATLETLEATAKTQGYTADMYIRTNFGSNVSKNDIYDCVVLESIASAYYEIIYDRFYDAVTDDDKDKYFEEHLAEFVSAKYLTYSIESSVAVPTIKADDYKGGVNSKAYKADIAAATADIDPEDYEGGKDSEEYKAAVAEAIEKAGIVAEDYDGGEESKAYKAAKAAAEAKVKAANEEQKKKDQAIIDQLAAAESAEDFKKIFLAHRYDTNAFNAAYVAAIKDISDSSKPSEADEKEFKEAIRDAVINAVLEGKDDIKEEEEKEEEEDKKEDSDKDSDKKKVTWESVKEELPATIIASLKKELTNAEKNPSYSLKEDLDKWLFGGVKAQFGIEYDEKEDKDGTSAKVNETKTEDKTVKEEIGSYKLTVYYVTEEAHRDETLLRDVGHILIKVDKNGDYKTSEDAKKKADEIYAEMQKKATDGIISKEDFETFGKEHTMDSSVFYENVGKGQMVEEFEEWLFAAEKEGEMGLIESSYGWHIMYFGGETDTTAWSFEAHESAANEDIEKWFEDLPYEITINEDVFNSILK